MRHVYTVAYITTLILSFKWHVWNFLIYLDGKMTFSIIHVQPFASYNKMDITLKIFMRSWKMLDISAWLTYSVKTYLPLEKNNCWASCHNQVSVIICTREIPILALENENFFGSYNNHLCHTKGIINNMKETITSSPHCLFYSFKTQLVYDPIFLSLFRIT